MIDQARFCLLIYKIDNFREHRLRRVEKFRMLACATFVPIAKGFPFCSIFSPAKHVAFARENEIGPHRKREIGETGLKQVDGAAGVDREEHAIVLQIAINTGRSVEDRKSTRLNSSHVAISYAVF